MDASIFALKRAFQATRKAMDEQLTPFGTTWAQLDVLIFLLRNGRSEQRKLQAALGITSATLTRMVDGMVERDLLERQPSNEDARVNWIVPSKKGLALCETLKKQEKSFLEEVFKGFSGSEVALLTDWLTRVADNMGDSSEGIYD
jgi:DNA-binding MarR family transcriptional regulator